MFNVGRLIDTLTGSHREKLDHLERSLYDARVKIAKLEQENHELHTGQVLKDSCIATLKYQVKALETKVTELETVIETKDSDKNE